MASWAASRLVAGTLILCRVVSGACSGSRRYVVISALLLSHNGTPDILLTAVYARTALPGGTTRACPTATRTQ